MHGGHRADFVKRELCDREGKKKNQPNAQRSKWNVVILRLNTTRIAFFLLLLIARKNTSSNKWRVLMKAEKTAL